MKIKLLHSPQVGKLIKTEWELPQMQKDQIFVKTKYCGICRNDIGGYEGTAFRMPLGREGHEAVGTVEATGIDYQGPAKVGDYVATFDSDPGFGEYFYTDAQRSVVVPELSPKYILEPVACAINIAHRTFTSISIDGDSDYMPKMLLIGSGFMSLMIKQYAGHIGGELEVAGKSNRKLWDILGVNIKPLQFYLDKKETFDAIIDLGGTGMRYKEIVSQLSNNGAVICMASTPKQTIKLDFDASAWKDLTYVFPSPRTRDFLGVMELCSKLIENKILDSEVLWSKEYKFDSIDECKQGFEDGLKRRKDYVKGYIVF